MEERLGAEVRAGAATFGDRVAEAVDRKRSQLVAGLDPRPELLPVELRGDAHTSRRAAADACARFCRGLVDAVAPYVVGVKPQLAFFEALGADGMRAFEEACAYADAYVDERDGRRSGVDALTVNPYLGSDAIEPFLVACRRSGNGLFCLVKTSNAGSADVQDLTMSDGRPLWQHVAMLVREWGEEVVGEGGLSSIGAVIGATYPRAVGEARKLMPQAILLLPGIGAQGATPADVARAFTSGPASALVPVSRALTYAFRGDGDDWRRAAAATAARLREEVWAVSGW